VTGLLPEDFVYEMPDTSRTPDSGTTTASRQTAFTGEATRIAAAKLKAALNGGDLSALIGREFPGEFSCATDPIGSKKPNPVSHLSYGYAATLAILDDAGKVAQIVAAYDIGQVINPVAAEGQIQGGILMGMGYALTEDFPVEGGYPRAKYGTLGLIRATEAPEMRVIFVEPAKKSPVACGAKGVGELATIPVCPAITGAYYKKDHIFREKIPITGTFYRK
jgi:CO/xanthine dehydrogenase Mo-binding subunit